VSRVHVFDAGADVAVWLDTDIGEEDGICLGLGPTTRDAIEAARANLELALVTLNNLALIIIITERRHGISRAPGGGPVTS